MNPFRLTADLVHLAAILILIWQIYRTKSCTGISGKSQMLFALVFSTRYVDLFSNFVSIYNSVLKVFFIISSYFTLYLIYNRFKETYEKSNDTFRLEFLILLAAALALGVNHVFELMEILWTFSIYLEAVALIPQLCIFHKTKDVSMFPTQYVLSIGSYRALYILNWIWRYYFESYYDLIAIGAGIVQTVIFFYFLFIYFSNKYNIREFDQLQPVVV